MSAAATRQAATPASIFATLCAELKPLGALESMLLDSAAQAMYRLQCTSAELLEILDKEGYSGHYFRVQRAEARDRASLTAFLNQFHKAEARRIKQADREAEHLDQVLDRTAAPTAPATGEDEPEEPEDAPPETPVDPAPSGERPAPESTGRTGPRDPRHSSA